MATPANGVYLRALQGLIGESGNRLQSNRLRTVLCEVNFAELVENVIAKKWAEAERQIANAAIALKAAGADFLVITSNTGNTLAELASAVTGLPILDIVEPTVAALYAGGCKSAGLLSTGRTLESQVFQNAGRRHDLEIVTPPTNIVQAVERLIFDELVYGVVTDRGLDTIVAAADWFVQRRVNGLILGCTDMTHLAARVVERTTLCVADTTVIHAAAAARAACSGVVEGAGMCPEATRSSDVRN
jgi:aspartate racemase